MANIRLKETITSTNQCPNRQLATRPTGEHPRLAQRMLMVTSVVPPTPYADAFVVKGLLNQFGSDEVVVASERTWCNPPEQTKVGGHRVHFIGRRWNWPTRGQKFFSWLRWLIVPRTVLRLMRLARTENCSVMFAHFPEEHLLLAASIVARWLKLPFFPFFHNTYRENRHGASRLLANWLQPRVLRQARLIFVMSDGMRREMEGIYPAFRFHALVHTFTEQMPSFEPPPPLNHGCIRIGYLGNVGDANLDALRRFCDLVNQSPDWSLDLYSGVPSWYLQKVGLLSERIKHEQPSDEALMAKLRANDILFLPHGLSGPLAAIEYRTIFPTRTIPYLLSGRPILAHSGKDTFLTEWLRCHDCAEVVDVPDPAALRTAVERLCNSQERREQLVRHALEAAKQFYAPYVVDELRHTINQFSR